MSDIPLKRVKHIQDIIDERDALRKRVEELEKDRRMREMVDWALVGAKVEVEIHDDWHTITDAQIDAAWRFVPEEQGCGIDDDESFSLHVLAQFLIVRCEECRGRDTCETCNGHGWVVKDE